MEPGGSIHKGSPIIPILSRINLIPRIERVVWLMISRSRNDAQYDIIIVIIIVTFIITIIIIIITTIMKV